MRLHKRSSLRAFTAGLALCMTFGTTACSGESSQNDDASADSDAKAEQITVSNAEVDAEYVRLSKQNMQLCVWQRRVKLL